MSTKPKLPDPRVVEWADSNLSYVGETKLKKMSIDDLQALHQMMSNKLKRPSSSHEPPSTVDVLVAEILQMKKERAAKPIVKSPLSSSPRSPHSPRSPDLSRLSDQPPRPDTPGPPPSQPPKVEPDPCAPPAAAAGTVAEVDGEAVEVIPHPEDRDQKENFVIVQKHGLRICSFNALKLRTEREGLADQWLALSAVFASFDVIMMCEIPAPPSDPRKLETSNFEQRVKAFASLLAEHTDDGRVWSMIESQPSGAHNAEGKLSGNPEVHVCFVKSPVKIVHEQWNTLHKIGDTLLEYAPFSVMIEDSRFLDPGEGLFLITSVHLPPNTTDRREARDAQLKALLKYYPLEASARLSKPFTSKGAKDARVAKPMHIICGDFNVFVDDETYGLTSNGWAQALIGEEIATSSGRKCYDNFVVDAESKRQYQLFAEVLQLAFPQKSNMGEIGLSDHNPIVLLVKDAQNTKSKAKATKKTTAPLTASTEQATR